MNRTILRTILGPLALLALAACSEPDATVSRCVPEGKCEELLHSNAAVFTSVGGDAAKGRALYEEKCARCHGPDGKGGQGPTASSADMTSPAWQQGRTDNQMRLTILRGRGMAMPSFQLKEQELKDVVAHVRSLKITPPPAEKGY